MLLARRSLVEVLGQRAEARRDLADEVGLRLHREERAAEEELVQHAAKAPRVDGRRVGQAEADLGRAVEARLDVGVDACAHEARRAEVDEADRRHVVVLGDEDVLGLEVAVHDAVLVRELERLEQLAGVLLDEEHGRRGEVAGLEAVVEIEPVKIEDKHVVATEGEGIAQTNEDRFTVIRKITIASFISSSNAELIDIFQYVTFDGLLVRGTSSCS